MQTEAQKAAKKRYDEKTTVQIKLKLNLHTDDDIITYLRGCDNVQGLIKRLVRDEMHRTV